MSSVLRFDEWQDSEGNPVLNGTGLSVPSSALPAGSILQVVSTAKTDVFSTTSGTFGVVTGLEVSITPSSTSSKILILAQIAHSFGSSGSTVANDYGHYKVTRGGTDIYRGNPDSSRIQAVFGGNNEVAQTLNSSFISFLDSPETTANTTYRVEARRGRSGSTAFVNRSFGDADFEFVTRGASSITVMEVAG